MPPPVTRSGTGSVLAAGGSSRLGRPKQLLPYRGATLLDAVLDTARRCGFDQLLVPLGGSSEQVRRDVSLAGTQPLENPDFGAGCSSSVRTAMAALDPRADGVVLLLGDQPGVSAATVTRLIAAARGVPAGLCQYADGPGHPLWFARSMFDALAALHGDKAVWKLLHSGACETAVVRVAGPVPADVDVPADYDRLIAGG